MQKFRLDRDVVNKVGLTDEKSAAFISYHIRLSQVLLNDKSERLDISKALLELNRKEIEFYERLYFDVATKDDVREYIIALVYYVTSYAALPNSTTLVADLIGVSDCLCYDIYLGRLISNSLLTRVIKELELLKRFIKLNNDALIRGGYYALN